MKLNPQCCHRGLVLADPTAAEANASRQLSNHGRCRPRSDVETTHITKDHTHNPPRRTCCTAIDVDRPPSCFSEAVYVRRRCHVSMAAASRHVQTCRVDDPTSLDPSSEKPFELTKLQSLRHLATMTEATIHQRCTNHRPDNRSPTTHRGRRHRNAATRRCHHETTLLNGPCDGFARTFGFPLRDQARPTPNTTPPGEPEDRSREHLNDDSTR